MGWLGNLQFFRLLVSRSDPMVEHVNSLLAGASHSRSLIIPSWNHFGCNINEDTILNAANALVSTGLRDLGYECTRS